MDEQLFETRAALIESGKKAFLEHGFDGAPLRDICAAAEVTTGAFYSNFSKKDDLFRAVVEDDFHRYRDFFDDLLDKVTRHELTLDEGERQLVEYVMDHRDLFVLLFDRSEGSSLENYRDEHVSKLEKSFQELFDSIARRPVSSAVVNAIVRMKFAQYREMVHGGYSDDEVRAATDTLADFTRSGLEAIFGKED